MFFNMLWYCSFSSNPLSTRNTACFGCSIFESFITFRAFSISSWDGFSPISIMAFSTSKPCSVTGRSIALNILSGLPGVCAATLSFGICSCTWVITEPFCCISMTFNLKISPALYVSSALTCAYISLPSESCINKNPFLADKILPVKISPRDNVF